MDLNYTVDFMVVIWLLFKLGLGVIIGLIWKEFIQKYLYYIVIILDSLIGFNKIRGDWKATFKYLDDNSQIVDYIEIIRLYCIFNIVVGRIIPHKLNGDRARELSKKYPLRLMGKIVDRTHLTGTWYHPNKTFNFYGSFQLTISPANSTMNGKWIGFNTERIVDCDQWHWEKIENNDKKSK